MQRRPSRSPISKPARSQVFAEVVVCVKDLVVTEFREEEDKPVLPDVGWRRLFLVLGEERSSPPPEIIAISGFTDNPTGPHLLLRPDGARGHP